MNAKTIIWICLFIGSTIGGYIPSLWGEGFISMSSVLLTAVGGIAGIYIGYRISRY